MKDIIKGFVQVFGFLVFVYIIFVAIASLFGFMGVI